MGLAEILPPINACLNGLSALCLLCGYIFIRKGRRAIHQRFMIAAFVASTVFLISYLVRFAVSGPHAFPGQGWLQTLYYVILFSHMALAVAVVPLSLRTLWLSWVRKRFDAHRRIARWTFPVWMYVSVTGVVVYLMLYHLPA